MSKHQRFTCTLYEFRECPKPKDWQYIAVALGKTYWVPKGLSGCYNTLPPGTAKEYGLSERQVAILEGRILVERSTAWNDRIGRARFSLEQNLTNH